jgi:hypothetical protein
MFTDNFRAQSLKTVNMHVEAARSDVVSPGHRDVCFATACKQRPKNTDRRTHAAHKVIVGAVIELPRDSDGYGASLAVVHDRAPHATEQLGHDLDVEDVWHFIERGGAFHQKGGGHQLQDAVLGTGDPHAPIEARSPDYP